MHLDASDHGWGGTLTMNGQQLFAQGDLEEKFLASNGASSTLRELVGVYKVL